MGPIIVIGGGHGGFHLALAYRELGGRSPVLLVDCRPGLPVQRPPLSKAYLAPPVDPHSDENADSGLHFRPAEFYEHREISLWQTRAVAIDRAARRVVFENGEELEYEHLVLATGARNRRPNLPGIDLEGVLELRTPEDARQLRSALASHSNVVILGGGFIGLEVAAAASKHGGNVTVVEALDRVMSRVVSQPISAYFQQLHTMHGVTIRYGQFVTAIHGEGRVHEVELANGSRIAADLVVFGIGVVPVDDLARDAGLTVGNGIEVDATLLTSDPHISAIGDCASFPAEGGRRRLESVQNAADHGRTVAARLVGSPQSYSSVPWFWSEQFNSKLQIAGVATGNEDQTVKLSSSNGFSVLHFAGTRLTVVESVNRPADHVAARRLIEAQVPVDPSVTRAQGFKLASLLT